MGDGGAIESKDPLHLWLALEVRRATARLTNICVEQDQRFAATPHTGARVTALLDSGSTICVELADATIAKTRELGTKEKVLSDARESVVAFTRGLRSQAIALAHFVGGKESSAVVQAAKQKADALCGDIEGAFLLALSDQRNAALQGDDQLTQLVSIWKSEASRSFALSIDEVQSQFSLAGRLGSHAHASALAEAAESAAFSMLSKASALELSSVSFACAASGALSAYDEFAVQVRERAMGLNGRYPNPKNGALADDLAAESRLRIESEVTKQRLGQVLARRHSKNPPANPLPPEEQIRGKMIELINKGMRRDLAAKHIRSLPGFEAVGNEHARRAVTGHLPLGRPKHQNK